MILGVLDTETSGKNEPEHRIVEFAGKRFDMSTSQPIDSLIRRYNPMRAIDKKAFEVHGISRDELAGEPLWQDGADELIAYLGSADVWCAHNGDWFDFPFIIREFERVGRRFAFRNTFDTMVNARWATSNGKNPALGELCQCLDVPYDPSQAHAAEYDIDVMAACIFAARRLGYFIIPSIDQLAA